MYGCGEQEAGVASGSGWNLWVWLLDVVVRRYIDFLILLIPTLVSVLFYVRTARSKKNRAIWQSSSFFFFFFLFFFFFFFFQQN